MSENPRIMVDYGIAVVEVQGGNDETVSDIYDIFQEEKEKIIPDIRKLKEADYQIQDEYNQLPDSEAVARNGSSATFG